MEHTSWLTGKATSPPEPLIRRLNRANTAMTATLSSCPFPFTERQDTPEFPRTSPSAYTSSFSSVDDLIVPWQQQDTSEHTALLFSSDRTDAMCVENRAPPCNVQQPASLDTFESVAPLDRAATTSDGITSPKTAEAAYPCTLKNKTPPSFPSNEQQQDANVKTYNARSSKTKRPVRFPPSLGLSSPQRRGVPAGSVELPVWLQRPSDTSQLGPFLEKVRKRLMFVNRRIHYLTNEKRALLSCLWSVRDENISLCFPDVSCAQFPPSQPCSSPSLQQTERNSSHTEADQLFFVKDTAEQCAVDQHSCRTPQPESNSSLSTVSPLWEASKVAGRSHDLLFEIEYKTDEAVVTKQMEEKEVLGIRPNAKLSSYAPPDLAAACSNDNTSKNCSASSSNNVITASSPILPQPLSPSYSALQHDGALDTSTSQDGERKSTQQETVAVEDASVDNVTNSKEKLFYISSLDDENVSAVRKKSKMIEEDCDAAILNIPDRFTAEYWNVLPNSTLRLWMGFFGMKSSEHAVRRSTMITELTRISDYLYSPAR